MKDTHMVCTDCVYAGNLLAEHHRVVRDEMEEVARGTQAREELKLLVNRPSPSQDHTGCNLYAQQPQGGQHSVGILEERGTHAR